MRQLRKGSNNSWARAERPAKVAALVAALNEECDSRPLPSADELALATPDWWRKLADKHGINEPSQETVAAVLAKLRDREADAAADVEIGDLISGPPSSGTRAQGQVA